MHPKPDEMSSERVEVSASSKADVLAYNKFSSVVFGFEIIDWTDQVSNNIGQLVEVAEDKRRIKRMTMDSTDYIFIELRLNYIEQLLWRFLPKYMVRRERQTIIDSYSKMGIEVRELPIKELEEVLLP